MKRVFIIHGWDGSPKEPMLAWLKKELKKRKFIVNNLKMPNPGEPKIKDWVNHLKKSIKNPDKDTYFIGHSIGCQAVLRYLQTLNKKIGGCILIAGWLIRLTGDLSDEEIKIAKPWIETQIKYSKIKRNTKRIIAIFSDNDPFVSLKNKYLFRKNLNAKIIVEHNKGHFSPDYNITKLPSALKSLLSISK